MCLGLFDTAERVSGKALESDATIVRCFAGIHHTRYGEPSCFDCVETSSLILRRVNILMSQNDSKGDLLAILMRW